MNQRELAKALETSQTTVCRLMKALGYEHVILGPPGPDGKRAVLRDLSELVPALRQARAGQSTPAE